ncbi:hypothetical protein WZ211_2681 [Enterococcus faecalis]|nr:hypothetical protein WZ211_2681 [Enterococcus faecalis]OSH38549.1 hypothetical protein WZ342_2057 [Enterococcus faecalis]
MNTTTKNFKISKGRTAVLTFFQNLAFLGKVFFFALFTKLFTSAKLLLTNKK